MADRVRCDLVVNEGGGDSFEYDGRRIYLVETGEKGVFRFTLTGAYDEGRRAAADPARLEDSKPAAGTSSTAAVEPRLKGARAMFRHREVASGACLALSGFISRRTGKPHGKCR